MTDEEIANESKQIELAIKKAELELKKNEQKKSGGFSITTSLPLLIAIISLAASAVTAFIQRDTSLKLEESRFRSELLLKALEAKDTDNISKMLLFMVNTKMLKDEDGSIRRIADKPEQLPVLLEAVPGIKYGTPKTARSLSQIVVSDTQVEINSAKLTAYLKQPAVYGSYHYLIGSNGEIEPLVPDSLIAYHTPQVNKTSIGIGVMHISNGLTGYNEKQIAALEMLLARLSKKYNISAKDINGKNHYNQRKRCDFDLVKVKIMAAIQERNQ